MIGNIIILIIWEIVLTKPIKINWYKTFNSSRCRSTAEGSLSTSKREQFPKISKYTLTNRHNLKNYWRKDWHWSMPIWPKCCNANSFQHSTRAFARLRWKDTESCTIFTRILCSMRSKLAVRSAVRFPKSRFAEFSRRSLVVSRTCTVGARCTGT